MTDVHTTTLVEKVPLTPGTMSFRFVRPEDYEFTAGQWFNLTIPSDAGPLVHHFTHSSAPGDPYLEYTTRLTGSPFKQAMEALPEGTEVTIEGPYGTFVLKEEPPALAFLTGGIGITPVRSMMRDLSTRPESAAADRRLTVIYGNEAEHTIAFGEEFAALEESVPGLKVVHVLSAPSDSWEGWRGHISREVLEGELGDLAGWHYYISGPPGMVDAMRGMLKEAGVSRRAITLEHFEGYA